jgi:hypothetical protein
MMRRLSRHVVAVEGPQHLHKRLDSNACDIVKEFSAAVLLLMLALFATPACYSAALQSDNHSECLIQAA